MAKLRLQGTAQIIATYQVAGPLLQALHLNQDPGQDPNGDS